MSTTPDSGSELDAAVARVRELSEQVVNLARQNGLVWLESYERVLRNLLNMQEQFAKGTGVEWASTLASTHANFVRETSEVVLGAMRDQLRR
jgi:16S rRNA C1402 (ribose-2'-O) methylase RsmI